MSKNLYAQGKQSYDANFGGKPWTSRAEIVD